MTASETTRRQGYAPAQSTVGRRGLHTRERILACATDLFVAHGFHGTSIDAIAKATGGSRATVYQYFTSKDEIYIELAATYRPAVLEHGRSLGRLGADAAGLSELHRWLQEWSELSEKYAFAFLNFPGVGTIGGPAEADADAAAQAYTDIIAAKLRSAGVEGIDPDDAAAVLLRVAHMLNMRNFRSMFGLSDDAQTTASLTIAVQRLLFPDTAFDVFATIGRPPRKTSAPPAEAPERGVVTGSPVGRDILSTASTLFAERGFYAVSMEEIATEAGISRATLYRYFRTKVVVLEELSNASTLESATLSAELLGIAVKPTAEILHAWLTRYVGFHRKYIGVISAWYDGAIMRQLSGDAVARGMRTLYRAALNLLSRYRIPPTMDPAVGGAIFLALLGRLTEYRVALDTDESDSDAADFMLVVLRRTLLGS